MQRFENVEGELLDPDVDEDSFVVPSDWGAQAEPFRGRGPAPTLSVDPSAPAVLEQLLESGRNRIDTALDHPQSDADLAHHAHLYLGQPAGLLRSTRRDASPLGAAVVVALLGRTATPVDRAIADAWVTAHGIAFAAEAGVLLAAVDLVAPGPRWDTLAVVKAPGRGTYDDLLARLRAHLALTGDASYAEVRKGLAEQRAGPLGVRIATSYLLPTEQDWLDDDLAEIAAAGLSRDHRVMCLLASATTPTQAEAILAATAGWAVTGRPGLLFSLAVNLGGDAAPILGRLLDPRLDAERSRRLIGMLAALPTDAAFTALLDRLDQKYVQPAVLETMDRFPARAMRLLAGAAAGTGARADMARSMLRGHAISNPGVVESIRPLLDSAAAKALDAVLDASARLPVASPDRLPPVLVSPPWTARRPRPKPKSAAAEVRIENLRPPSAITLVWGPGEQEQWATTVTPFSWLYNDGDDWADLVDKAVKGDSTQVEALALGPTELVRPHLATLEPVHTEDTEPSLRRLLGRFGEDAAGFVLRAVLTDPKGLAGALLPYEGSEISARMAEWYAGTSPVLPSTLAWFDRHPATAATDLVPLALGGSAKERSNARSGLMALVRLGHADAIRTAASTHGPGVVKAIEALGLDPLQLLPARIPVPPSWLDPAHLPQVLLVDRTAALPTDAVGHICTMGAISKPGQPYPGIDVVRQTTDPTSLAEMAWGVFERWGVAGFPAKDGAMVFACLGLLGDDETVRRLAPLIRAWPGQSAHARAVAALDVLATIGSDVALMYLHGIAEKARFKGLKGKAQEKMEEVAVKLGLTADQLADRLVPDFGLDPDGSLLIDYGSRRFRVGFDEELKPVVSDEEGARRKLLPKPSAEDDPTLAPAAYARFTGLKKDVKTVATDQIRRFERAMVTGRRWTATEQRSLFVHHPLLWHLARRLVWAIFDAGSGVPRGSFRVAEDRTLADENDETVGLGPDTAVGIAHPLHLGLSLAAWSELFADYEILQPFPQLGREVYALADSERSAKLLDRFAGTTVYTGRILALTHRGWRREPVMHGDLQRFTFRPLADGKAVVVDFQPGIVAGEVMTIAEQTVTRVRLADRAPDWGGAGGASLPFGLLEDVTASEVLRDLEGLRQ